MLVAASKRGLKPDPRFLVSPLRMKTRKRGPAGSRARLGCRTAGECSPDGQAIAARSASIWRPWGLSMRVRFPPARCPSTKLAWPAGGVASSCSSVRWATSRGHRARLRVDRAALGYRHLSRCRGDRGRGGEVPSRDEPLSGGAVALGERCDAKVAVDGVQRGSGDAVPGEAAADLLGAQPGVREHRDQGRDHAARVCRLDRITLAVERARLRPPSFHPIFHLPFGLRWRSNIHPTASPSSTTSSPPPSTPRQRKTAPSPDHIAR